MGGREGAGDVLRLLMGVLPQKHRGAVEAMVDEVVGRKRGRE